jgi:DNA-binding transcriptional ArsR family regulator
MTDPQPVLAALADPTRRAVFERLTSDGPATATTLAAEMPVSRQAIAKHLTALGSAGLVDRVESGREVVYSARTEPLAELTTWVETVGDEWDRRLRGLRQSFSEDSPG